MADEAKSQVDNESAAQDAAKQTASAQTSEETFDAEYVRKLRAEAADYRKRLRDLEGRVKTEEETRMPEQERLQKKTKELEQQVTQYQQSLRERTLRYEVMLAASKLGIVDPDAAFRLLDTASLEFDDNGQPKDVERALKALLSNKPYLAAGAGHASATNPAGGTSKAINGDPMILAARRAAGLPVEGDK